MLETETIKDYLPACLLILELLSSIRNINRRIDEIAKVLNEERTSDYKLRGMLYNRIEMLSKTRNCLIKTTESVMNGRNDIKNISKELAEI